jgi:DNA invertase Pin-like site-specific DNA recombinase
MLIGYARVSTDDQKLDLQLDALKKAGCDRVFEDCISGAKSARPGLDEALNICRSGDTLVVWRLDRLGRSIKNLIQLAEDLQKRGVELKSLSEDINTGSPNGKLTFHLFGALAEFERNLMIERINSGIAAARARGKTGGRPKLLDANKQQLAIDLYTARKHSIKEIHTMLGISKTTLYAYLDGHLDKQKPKVESVTH